MKPEVEAKFLNVNHDEVRAKLKELGAKLEVPMRTMRRTILDYPDGRFETRDKSRLRVRDESDKVTVTYKTSGDGQYQDEIETTVGSYETMIELFEAIGLKKFSAQETKRETWTYRDAEIVLDEWPWVKPYIEIEGESQEAITEIAKELGFDWSHAVFGGIEAVYRAEYPGMKPDEVLGQVGDVSFDMPLPGWLEDRK